MSEAMTFKMMDLEAVLAKISTMSESVEEAQSSLATYLADTEELKDVGANLVAIRGCFEEISQREAEVVELIEEMRQLVSNYAQGVQDMENVKLTL